MNKDQTQGRAKEVEGKIKEVTGILIGDKELETKGKIKHQVGKAQAAFGDVKEDIKKAVS